MLWKDERRLVATCVAECLSCLVEVEWWSEYILVFDQSMINEYLMRVAALGRRYSAATFNIRAVHYPRTAD
jgi:hypothetical protein